MKKIGQFIYPWGNGHYSRMMRLNDALNETMGDELETHFFSKGVILEKLLKKFPRKKDNIHEILMPTPIDGKFGPSVSMSLLNLLVPVSDNQPLVTQISILLDFLTIQTVKILLIFHKLINLAQCSSKSTNVIN